MCDTIRERFKATLLGFISTLHRLEGKQMYELVTRYNAYCGLMDRTEYSLAVTKAESVEAGAAEARLSL